MESRSLPDTSPQQQSMDNALVSSTKKPLGSTPSQNQPTILQTPDPIEYRLYKQRFVGLTALVILNIIGVLPGTWFGPISNEMSHDFGISLNQVNWLSNVCSCVFLPTSLFVPKIVSKYGIHRCIAAVALLISSWIRYSGTVHGVSGRGAYALLLLGQLTSAVAAPIFQIIGSKYSETWFDLEGRTTATMVAAIAGPVGYGVGQILSPLFTSTRQAILGLGIISTAVTPLALLVTKAPPTPPTYSASKPSPSLITLVRSIVGKVDRSSEAYMSVQSRIDFVILMIVFGIFVGTIDSFSVLTGEIFACGPEGYNAVTCGLLGASVLFTGIVGAIITAPLFDRVFTHHLAITIKLLVPILAAAWLSLVWAVRPHNKAALFAIMTVVGVTSITLLPIFLELTADITRNADGSSALLWFAGNLVVVPYILVQEALRAGPHASPPNHMRHGLKFTAILAMTTASLVFLVRGKQERKQIDEAKLKESGFNSNSEDS